jgi:hypothetical protein
MGVRRETGTRKDPKTREAYTTLNVGEARSLLSVLLEYTINAIPAATMVLVLSKVFDEELRGTYRGRDNRWWWANAPWLWQVLEKTLSSKVVGWRYLDGNVSTFDEFDWKFLGDVVQSFEVEWLLEGGFGGWWYDDRLLALVEGQVYASPEV